MGDSKIGTYLKIAQHVLFRNDYGMMDIKANPGRVNVEYFPMVNVGDLIGPVIVKWMLEKKNIDPDKEIGETRHLITVGSIVSLAFYDATVWGSGILGYDRLKSLKYKRVFLRRKLDVRAVRGPVTRDILRKAGYKCPKVYGDPAILMPLLYQPDVKKKYEVSMILHHRTHVGDTSNNQTKNPLGEEHGIDINPKLIDKYGIHFIDPKTEDYEFFIREICASKRVVSSSLHGIILAESYGVPATFLNFGVADESDKYNDWYLSTGRKLRFSTAVEEALEAAPPSLPDLTKLREGLINSFPYDLWEK